MTPKTFIFMGTSGSGKGTQARLLNEHLSKEDPANSVLYIETGARFRTFIKEPGYSNSLSNKIMEEGGRQPDFLAVWNWGDKLLHEAEANSHFIFDGAGRSLQEAEMLDTAVDFYGRSEVYVFFLNASPEWAKEKALARGREYDLIPGENETKLIWFKEKVVPALNFFKTNPRYKYIEINAEQTIEKVQQDISSSIQW